MCWIACANRWKPDRSPSRAQQRMSPTLVGSCWLRPPIPADADIWQMPGVPVPVHPSADKTIWEKYPARCSTGLTCASKCPLLPLPISICPHRQKDPRKWLRGLHRPDMRRTADFKGMHISIAMRMRTGRNWMKLPNLTPKRAPCCPERQKGLACQHGGIRGCGAWPARLQISKGQRTSPCHMWQRHSATVWR